MLVSGMLRKWKLILYIRRPQNSCLTLPQSKIVEIQPKRAKIILNVKMWIRQCLENESFQSEYQDSKTVFWLDPSPKKAHTASQGQSDTKIFLLIWKRKMLVTGILRKWMLLICIREIWNNFWPYSHPKIAQYSPNRNNES